MRLRKRVDRLVLAARERLLAGDREGALQEMRSAVKLDGNRGLIIQSILDIERRLETGELPESDIDQTQDEPISEERNTSMASDDRLERLFAASDKAYDHGDQAKAMNFLKKARKLAPESPEVEERLDLLKKRIKSSNMVCIAQRELEKGNKARAIELSRQAFELLPEATGLDELLAALEEGEGPSGETTAGIMLDEEVPEYISVIRALIQDNSLEAAAARASAELENNPEDELLVQFVQRFTKLGLLD